MFKTLVILLVPAALAVPLEQLTEFQQQQQQQQQQQDDSALRDERAAIRPIPIGPVAGILPAIGIAENPPEPIAGNSFDSDYRPLDYGYLPGTTRYLGNRLKGSGYTSLFGLNYESVGYRDDYYSSDAYPQHLGQGQVRVNGQDAELTCQFPPTMEIISNIVWEKVERNGVDTWSLDRQNPRFSIRQQSPTGSRLVIGEYAPRDEGIYRCIATRRDGTHFRQTRTVYQDIPFMMVK